MVKLICGLEQKTQANALTSIINHLGITVISSSKLHKVIEE